jgi:hypothetical protein
MYLEEHLDTKERSGRKREKEETTKGAENIIICTFQQIFLG